MGVRKGSVDSVPLRSHVEALTLRFNRRNSSNRGLLLRGLIEQGVVAGLLTVAELTFGFDWSRIQRRRSYPTTPLRVKLRPSYSGEAFVAGMSPNGPTEAKTRPR